MAKSNNISTLASFGITLDNTEFLKSLNQIPKTGAAQIGKFTSVIQQFDSIFREMGTDVSTVMTNVGSSISRVNFQSIIDGATSTQDAIARLSAFWRKNTEEIDYASINTVNNIVKVERAMGRVAQEVITAPKSNNFAIDRQLNASQYAKQSSIYQNMTPEEALAHQTNFFSTQDILGNDRVAKANFVEGLLNSTEKANQDLGKQLNDIIGEYDNFIKRIRINYNRLGEVVGTDVQLLLDNNKILTESFRRTDIQGGDGNTFQRTTGQTYSETIQDTEIDQQNQYIALLKQEADLQNKINLENAKGNSQKANELVIQQNLIKAQMEQLETQRQQQGRGSFAIGSANVPQSITEARQNIANTSNILQERNNVTSLIEKIKEYQDIWKKLQNSKSKGNREETALLGSQLNNLTALIQQDKARFSLSTNSANIIRNLENENQEERNLIQTRERDNEAKKQNSQNTSELNSYLSQYVTLLREQSQIENKNDNVLYANSLDLVQQKMAQLNNNLTTGLQGLITYDEATKKFVFNETQAATSANLTSENIDKLRLATEQANNQMQQMNNSTKHQNEIEQINKTVAAYEKLKLAQYQLYNLQLSQPSSNKTKAQAIEVNNLTSEYNKQISIMNSLNANLVNSETYKNRMAQADERALNSANHYNTVVAKETTLLSRLGDQLKMVGRNVLNYNVFQMAFNKLRREIREAITIIKELDSAMLEIQLVTNGTDQEVRNLVVSYADLAKQLGVTLNSVTQGSVEWLRQGKTISEVNKLLTASTQLAKLGAMEASDASEKLTAILNSYKMEVEDVTSVVDKLVKVDLIAATSTEELSTSLQYSASFAANAGVSFDKMIGLIATASETTRLSAETIGQAFKSIFSRMQNVKAGANVDDMGESLNNTEKVLRKYGIELRDTADEFRNIEEVIDEVGAKWEQFTSIQQGQIATAMAGVHQRNTFIATMSNYNKVLEYTTEATNAEGTAEEKYVNVLDSIEAKLNTLSTTWQIFINNMNMSEGFGNIVDSGTAIIEVLDVVMNKFSALEGILSGVGFIAVAKLISSTVVGFSKLGGILTFATSIWTGLGTVVHGVNIEMGQGIAPMALRRSELLKLSAVQNKLSIAEIQQMIISKQLTAENYKQILSEKGLNVADIALLESKGLLQASQSSLAVSQNAQGLATQNLSFAEIQQMITSKALTAENYKQVLSSKGLTMAEIEQLVANGSLIVSEQNLTMNQKASIGVTNALKTARLGLNAVMVAASIVIGITVAVITALNQAEAEHRQSMVDSLEKQKEYNDSLEDTIDTYIQLKKKIDSANLSEEEIYNTKSELFKMQEDIIDTNNLEKDSIDLINGSLTENINLLKKQRREKNRQTVSDTEYEALKAAKRLQDYSSYFTTAAFDTGVTDTFSKDVALTVTNDLKNALNGMGFSNILANEISDGYGVFSDYVFEDNASTEEKIQSLSDSIDIIDTIIQKKTKERNSALTDAEKDFYLDQMKLLGAFKAQVREEQGKLIAITSSEDYKADKDAYDKFSSIFIESEEALDEASEKIENSIDKYNNAVLKGDKNAIKTAKVLYDNAISEYEAVASTYSDLDEKYQIVISENLESLKKTINTNNAEMQELFSSGILSSEMFDGKTDVDIMEYYYSDSAKVSENFKGLKEQTDILGMSINEVIKSLQDLGYVEKTFSFEETEFDVFDYASAITGISDLSTSYKTLGDVLDKISSKEYTLDDALSLAKDFPELQDYLSSADKDFKSFANGIEIVMSEMSDILFENFNDKKDELSKKLESLASDIKESVYGDFSKITIADDTSFRTVEKTLGDQTFALTINPVLPDGSIMTEAEIIDYINNISSMADAKIDPIVVSMDILGDEGLTDELIVQYESDNEILKNKIITYNDLEESLIKVVTAMALLNSVKKENKTITMGLLEAFNKLKDSTSEIISAYSQLISDGYLSGDNMIELLDKYPELMKYYDEETGRLILKKEILKELFEQERQLKLLEIQNEIDRIKNLKKKNKSSTEYSYIVSQKEMLEIAKQQGKISDEIYANSLNDLVEFGSVQSQTVLDTIKGISDISNEALRQMITAKIISGNISTQQGAKILSDLITENYKYASEIKALEDEYKVLSTYNPFDEIENSTSEASDALSKYKSYLSEIINLYDKISSAIEKAVDLEIEALDKEKDALQKTNDEQERKLALLEKEEALNRAKSQRTVRVYNADTGKFEWEVNSQEVKDAQKAYDEELAKQENDKKLEEIDIEKEALQQFKKQITDISSNVKDAEDLEFAKKYFNVDSYSDLLNLSEEQLSKFVKEYSSASHLSNNIALGESYKIIKEGGILSNDQLSEYFGTDFNTIGMSLYNVVTTAFQSVMENVNALANKSATSAQVIQTTTNGDSISIGEIIVQNPKNFTDILNEAKKQSSTKNVK